MTRKGYGMAHDPDYLEQVRLLELFADAFTTNIKRIAERCAQDRGDVDAIKLARLGAKLPITTRMAVAGIAHRALGREIERARKELADISTAELAEKKP